MKWPLVIAGLLLVIAGIFVAYETRHGASLSGPNATSTPISTSTPQVVYTNASTDDIVLNSPTPGITVGHSFSVTGQARGTWYFEASFPIEVTKPDGSVLVQTHGSAQGDWMTPDFVPFSASVDVGSYRGLATLTLKRDNPSGMPSYDASISLPITITGPASPSIASSTPATTTATSTQ